MNNSTVIKECANGTIREFTMENGTTFEAYVPNNCNANTPIITYEHGDGGYDSNWVPYQNYLAENDCNSIIIHGIRNHSVDPFNYLVNEYNLNADSAATISFSGGTMYALTKTAKMIEQNPNCSSPVSVILDGYVAPDYLQSQGYVDKLIESDTVVLGIHQNNQSNNYLANYESLAKKGVNVLILEDQSSYGNSHNGVNQSFLEQGLIDYITEGGTLPNNYKIKRYDAQSGQFLEVSYDEISTLDGVYNLFGAESNGKITIEAPKYSLSDLSNIENLVLKSDDKALENALNGIRNVVKNSNIVSSGGASGGFSSSTMIPSQVPTVVSEYIAATSLALSNIVAETDQFAQIANSINQLNYNLERQAVEIEEINIVEPEYGKTSSTNEEETTPTIAIPLTTPSESEEKEEETEASAATSIAATAGSVISTTSATLATGVTGISGTMSQVMNNSSKNTSSSGTNTSSTTPTYVERTTEQLDVFPEYADLKTDEDSLVFESNEGYKLVVHNDGENVTGVEHYYEFDDMEQASSKIDEIKNAYINNKYFKGIIQDGNKIKVIFDNRVYENLTLQGIDELYNGLDHYIKINK